MKKISLTILAITVGNYVFAQTAAATPPAKAPMFNISSSDLLIIALFVFATVVLFATMVILKALKVIVKERMNPTPFVKYEAEPLMDYDEWLAAKKNKPNIWTKLLSLKPIEEEKSLVIPHAYDGINELDNPVPKWFNILFYGTLIFAVVYLYYYQIGDGPKQDEEYAAEMEKAVADQRAFLAKAGEKYDENTIKVDKTLIANGKAVFMANCTACHGEHGEGLVGPNLTDEYWLHGGTISDIFKTVKYGVPAKGMASWEKNLSAKNIAEVVNYIESLQGSNPANAKAPQGEKYEAKAAIDTVKNETIAKK